MSGLLVGATLLADPLPASAAWWGTFGTLYLLSLAAGNMAIPVTPSGSTTSVEYVPHLAAVVLLGPSAAALLVVGAVPFVEIFTREKGPRKTFFNTAQMALAAAAAGWVYQWAGAEPSLSSIGFPETLLPFLAAVVVYFATNTVTVSTVISLAQDRPVARTWQRLSGRMFGFDVFVSTVAYGVAWLDLAFGHVAVLLGLVPLYVLRYTYGSNVELENLNIDLLRTTMRLVESQDPYTSGHSARVAESAQELAAEMGLWSSQARQVQRAALLHDIGKIDRCYRGILDEEGPLTEEEWELVEAHPERGVELLSSVRSLDERVRAYIRHHHERWDGEGYPDGLEGREIPVGARVIAVADTVDAMLTTRPYRDALSPETVVEELEENAGS
ncbi:MAG: HD-GYP domain-containing protein, partial [Gemmatimonadota bacterium]